MKLLFENKSLFDKKAENISEFFFTVNFTNNFWGMFDTYDTLTWALLNF